MNDLIHNSKKVAHLLRHTKMPDRKAWARVDMVLSELNLSMEDIIRIVNDDTKGRFEFSEDKTFVRALYGHSIDVDLGLKPTVPPIVLYHGTAEKYIANIMNEGLKPRKRNFVHLSETVDMARQVGARHGSPVVLSIDTEAMIGGGGEFYKAQNGIWLANMIDKKYITIII